MSDYGLLQEVRIVYRGSTLTAAAGIGDTELSIEYAGDFNYDPDDPDASGGTLDLNGTRYAYTAVTFGEAVEDPDVVLLATPLTAAADADDFVGVVAGGQVLEDWVAYITMGEGDQVVVPLSVDQRNQWPVGVYADPVPVVISDDLLHLEDAPGRTAPSRVQFMNTDIGTCASDGADIDVPLSHVPIPGSEQAYYNGTPLKRADWTRTDSVLTIPGETWFRSGKVAWVDYAYDGAQVTDGPAITSPETDEALTDSTPTVSGVGVPGYTITASVDGTPIGTTTVASDGTWSVTSSTLSVGPHTATAVQTAPDGSALAAAPVDFSVVTVPATFRAVSSVAGDHSSIPLPTGTVAGDMLILVMSARATATCGDSRFTSSFTADPAGVGPGGVWIGTADGSGSPVPISLVSSGIGDGADGAAALMAISGDPLTLNGDATSTTVTMPFAPAMPATSPTFGIAALFGTSGGSSGAITDELTSHWTTRSRVQGGGAGKCSVYLGTAAGLPSGSWNNSGSTINGGARVLGVQ